MVKIPAPKDPIKCIKWKKKISEALTGKPPHAKGKHWKKESKIKLSKTLKGIHLSPKTEFKKGNIPWWIERGLQNPIKNPKIKNKMIETIKNQYKEGRKPWNTGKKAPEEVIKRLRESHIGKPSCFKGKHHSEENKRKMSERKIGQIPWWVKKGVSNPMLGRKHPKEWFEKTIPKIIKGLFKRPTSLEKQMIELIRKYNLPFKYCGDGSLLIGYKNPDFYENNGKKICLEVANRYHHPDPWAENRIKHFSKYGWKCLIFFGNKKNNLEENESLIIQKINSFMKVE